MERTSSSVYPFVKCFEPQLIINKYTHERMIVSCGKCEACLSRKSFMSTLKCQLECKAHIYCKFVTLTYDDAHIPRMAACMNHETLSGIKSLNECSRIYKYVELEPRLNGTTLESFSPFEQKSSHHVLSNKVSNKYLPYLCKRDLQLFIKRLRRNYERLSKKFNIPFGEIRYFACGEYGPVHFRPHYHLLLWYSCDEVHKTIGEVVSKSWQLGRLTTETPRDDVSKYVAKYVNGNSHLPEIYKSAKIRPFSLHSQHLGESFFEKRKEEIYESSSRDIVSKGCFINGSYTDVNMWRSLKTYYFPRCKAYTLCTSQQRLYAYTIKEEANRILGKGTIVSQARLILAYLYDMSIKGIPFYGQFSSDPLENDFYKYFVDMCDIQPLHFNKVVYYERALRSVYMVLRLSHHFIRFCCDGNLSRCHLMLKKIEQFYSDCDMLNLKNQYLDLEEFAQDWFDDEEEYNLCFTLNPDAIRNTSVFKRFRARTINRFNDSMKHKKLNDLNKIFENLK